MVNFRVVDVLDLPHRLLILQYVENSPPEICKGAYIQIFFPEF